MTKKNKLFLVGMSGPNSEENLRELLQPIKEYFDGIVWTLHDSYDSNEAKFLEEIKGEGKVIHYHYSQRHDVSRNQYLYCGPIKNGDWCCQIDELERIPVEFAKQIPEHTKELKDMGANIAYFFGKPYLFEYHESLKYQGSPHEGLIRQDGKGYGIELNKIFPDENKVRINVRPLKRKDIYQWVEHYSKYMLMPWGANHCLLGLEHRFNTQEDLSKEFQRRELLRLEFLDYIDNLGLPRTVDTIITLFSGPLDKILKKMINEERVWNDLYRYKVCRDLTVKDDHTWQGMIKV
jgi:hypothetical protein